MKLSRLILLLALAAAGCAENPPAPVIDRTPPVRKPAAPPAKPTPVPPAQGAAPAKDWRPDVYTVKKGDTLHSIGLEYGYDYKEIAQANNIVPPYVIHIGQQLKLGDLKASTDKNAADGNVVITPLNTDGAVTAAPVPVAPADDVPLIKEPKAIREPYSVQALVVPAVPANVAATPPKAAEAANPAEAAKPETPAADASKPASKADEAKPPAAKPEPAKADAAKPEAADDETIDWGWPAQGKITAGFNDASSAKGIDISGVQGQDVLAAAAGKVIYSGADLRGYGKLVIIKHNKTYLSVYAHNNLILVREGQQVAKGQKIAEMGSSDSDKVKLHFEIRRQGKSVDPAKYLAGNNN